MVRDTVGTNLMVIHKCVKGLAVTDSLKGTELGGYYGKNLKMSATSAWFQSPNEATQLKVTVSGHNPWSQ